MNELLCEIDQVLSDLLQSGISTRWSSTAEELHGLSQQCKDMGMHTGSTLLIQLEKALLSRGHLMIKDDINITSIVCRVVRYLELCKEKLSEEEIYKRWDEKSHNKDSL